MLSELKWRRTRFLNARRHKKRVRNVILRKDARIAFLFDLIKPYKHIFIGVVLLSALGPAFDGISIGFLVPLLSSVQRMEGNQNFPAMLRWLTEFLHPFTSHQQMMLSMGFVL